MQLSATTTTRRAEQPNLSPRDSLSTTIAGSTIKVNYGRPSKRGRVLFNGLGDMKWGMVWRTGANEATHFTTSKPLMFGSAMVPAGTYTLYTIPTASAWTLVVNKQTGQWGTEYNQGQDLARIPMKASKTTAPAEQFTIAVEPKGATGGVLAMTLPIARDLMNEGVRVNTILPGVFKTPMVAMMPPQVQDALGAQVPFPKRLGRPEEYANLAVFMIESGYMNAEHVRLDGGIRMAPK